MIGDFSRRNLIMWMCLSTAFAGCTNSVFQGDSNPKKKAESPSDNHIDTEKDDPFADDPDTVMGTFLTCTNLEEVDNRYQTGCNLYSKETRQRVNFDEISESHQWSHQVDGDQRGVAIQHIEATSASDEYHVTYILWGAELSVIMDVAGRMKIDLTVTPKAGVTVRIAAKKRWPLASTLGKSSEGETLGIAAPEPLFPETVKKVTPVNILVPSGGGSTQSSSIGSTEEGKVPPPPPRPDPVGGRDQADLGGDGSRTGGSAGPQVTLSMEGNGTSENTSFNVSASFSDVTGLSNIDFRGGTFSVTKRGVTGKVTSFGWSLPVTVRFHRNAGQCSGTGVLSDTQTSIRISTNCAE